MVCSPSVFWQLERFDHLISSWTVDRIKFPEKNPGLSDGNPGSIGRKLLNRKEELMQKFRNLNRFLLCVLLASVLTWQLFAQLSATDYLKANLVVVQPTHYVPAPTSPLGGNFFTGYNYSVRQNSTASASPIWGYVDMHGHLEGSMAFGKKALVGDPDGPESYALRDCSYFHGPGGIGLFGQAGSLFIGLMEGGFGHYTSGYPNFDGWPRYTTMLHQQMYIDSLKRAYAGGLRLLVAPVVQNGLLAHEFNGIGGYNDGQSIEEQIQAMKDLTARNSSFVEVAYTPADARRIIASGRLALVLAVEVDSLGTPTQEFGASEVPPLQAHLQHMYDLGVRHLFPIHLANNALGGTAVYGTLFNVLNWHLRGNYFNVTTTPGTDFRLDNADRNQQDGIIANFYWISGFHPPDYAGVPGGHGNSLGLTDTGTSAVLQMMRLGMVIDTDHSSEKAFQQMLALAEKYRFPVVGGHMAMRDLMLHRGETTDSHKLANEYGRNGSDVTRIAALGGMIGVGLNQTHLHTYSATVRNDAHNTSKSFAQAYLYALDRTGGTGVAIGTDFNGLAKSLGPRFGPAALPGYDPDPSTDVSTHCTPGVSSETSFLRRNELNGQLSGVAYSSPLSYVSTARWNPGDALTCDERDIWQGIALARSGRNIQSFDLSQVAPAVRSVGSQIWIRNIATGMRATSLSSLPQPSVWDQLFNYNSARVQRAAYYAKTENDPNAIQDASIRNTYEQIRPVYLMYSRMDGPNPPIARSVLGNRDFDINVDGVAHAGMLPDLLQDLRNIGVTAEQLAPFFRSAEDYIAMWETINVRRASVPVQP